MCTFDLGMLLFMRMRTGDGRGYARERGYKSERCRSGQLLFEK